MSQLLGKQFDKQQTKNVAKKPTRSTKTVADAVYDQLTEDYPKDAVNWVHNIKWKGPIEVPLSDIDFENERSWKAAHERDKVEVFRRRIRAAKKKGEHIKATILIQRPKQNVMVVDGHHRTIASQEENIPVYGFVGYPVRAKGPWDTAHDKQFRPDTGPQRTGNKGENVYR